MSSNPLCCRWHEYNWLACRYCATHLENQIPKCDPSEPCTICDQTSLTPEQAQFLMTRALGDEAGAVTLGRVVVILLATIGALITIPIVLLILIVLLGAPV